MNRMESQLLFTLFCVCVYMCVLSVYVFSKIELKTLVIFNSFILAYFIVKQSLSGL